MKWSVENAKYIIDDKWLKVRSDKCIMPSGKIVEPYYVLEYPDWINVLGVTKNNDVILVKNYRHGVGKIVVELPSGIIEDTDESPIDAAKRELLEETGYTSNSFIKTGIVSPNPSNHNNYTYCFLARELELVQQPKLDETEEIETILIPIIKLTEMLRKGKILQAMHVSSIFYGLSYLNKLMD